MIKTTFYGYPLIYQNDNNYSLPNHTGAVQWNGTAKKFQVSNGSMWYDIYNQINFNVDSRLQSIVEWAEKKMSEERELEELAKTNPTIQDLLFTLRETENKIKVVKTLVTK